MIRKALDLTALVLLVGGLAVGAHSRADAQYPPPIGNVTIAVSDGTAGASQDVGVTATVVDTNGDPAAGASCTFSIAQQPGADASVEAGPFTTNADGQVTTTLHTGSAIGSVVVAASCVRAGCSGQSGCALSANATVSVGQAAPSAGPPASLPDTGTGSGRGGDGGGWLVWAFLAAGGGALLAAMAMRFRRSPGR